MGIDFPSFGIRENSLAGSGDRLGAPTVLPDERSRRWSQGGRSENQFARSRAVGGVVLGVLGRKECGADRLFSFMRAISASSLGGGGGGGRSSISAGFLILTSPDTNDSTCSSRNDKHRQEHLVRVLVARLLPKINGTNMSCFSLNGVLILY